MSAPTRIGAREDYGDKAIRIDTSAGSMYLVIAPSRDPIDKQVIYGAFPRLDYSTPVRTSVIREPVDPSWWSAVLAVRAAFAAQPGAALISVPLHGGTLSVSAEGSWRASAQLPDDVAAQLPLSSLLPLPPARARDRSCRAESRRPHRN